VNRVSGKLVVTKVAKTLHKVTLSNGKTETFDFALDDHMRPTLKISGMDNRSFTWNRRTKKILKDGDWTYKVVLAPKKDRIIRGGKRFANAKIQRTNSAGQTESWFRDYKNGTTTIQNLDGTKVVKQRFLGSGLAGKMRQIVETKNGKSTVVLNRIYGDDHQLLRQTDGSGNTYEWKQEGADRVYTENNVPLIKTTYDASGRPVHETDLRNNVQTSYEYSNQGSQQIVQFPSGVSFLKSYDSHGTLVSNQYLNNANGGGK
jgi:YD repeat-containing protein